MASLRITTNAGDVAEACTIAANGVTDWRDGFELLREPWEQRGRDMFATLGRSTGTPWPLYEQTPERERYVFIKAKLTGRPVSSLRELTWTPGRERLRPSLIDTRHPLAVFAPEPLALALGTRVDYAALNDAGIGLAPAWAGGYVRPRRPLIAFSREFVDAIRVMMALIERRAMAQATTGRRVGLSSADVSRLL